MRRIALAAAALALAFPAAAPAAPGRGAAVPRIVGLPYPQARARLIRAGWRPVEYIADPRTVELASGNGPDFLARGYRELVSCSGTGLAPCSFVFRRAGRLLHVTTRGEGVGARVAFARVEPGLRD